MYSLFFYQINVFDVNALSASQLEMVTLKFGASNQCSQITGTSCIEIDSITFVHMSTFNVFLMHILIYVSKVYLWQCTFLPVKVNALPKEYSILWRYFPKRNTCMLYEFFFPRSRFFFGTKRKFYFYHISFFSFYLFIYRFLLTFSFL